MCYLSKVKLQESWKLLQVTQNPTDVFLKKTTKKNVKKVKLWGTLCPKLRANYQLLPWITRIEVKHSWTALSGLRLNKIVSKHSDENTEIE